MILFLHDFYLKEKKTIKKKEKIPIQVEITNLS